MQVSNTIMEEFKNYVTNQSMSLQGVDLSVRILTTGFWPTQSSTPNCTIPNAPRLAFDTFKKFYLSKHSGRQLTLQPQLGEISFVSEFLFFEFLDILFFLSLGTAFMNAVFYGPIKNTDNEGECTSQSVSQCSIQEQPKTRKHVLQVSTYQVWPQ